MEYHHQLQEGNSGGVDGLELPLGVRFHPSDEEIIAFYLTNKVRDDNFTAIAIGEVDINKSEPWELPYKAKMGENEWYFYCLKDHKYHTGHRANRATEAGYWKATGKDKEIYCDVSSVPMLLGMKKTLVFYKGRAPKGVKTNWVMHEYRLDAKGRVPSPAAGSNSNTKKPCSSSKEWVVCRFFNKSSGIRKEQKLTPVSELPYRMTMRGGAVDLESESIPMPTQQSMTFPIPTQFPVGINKFTINSNRLNPLMDDPSASFYSTNGMGSSNPHPLLPMVSMGLQTNNYHFGNSKGAIIEPMSFHQQMGAKNTSDFGFMVDPDIRPTSMLLQDVRACPDQTNATHILSVVNPGHVASSSVDMNTISKY